MAVAGQKFLLLFMPCILPNQSVYVQWVFNLTTSVSTSTHAKTQAQAQAQAQAPAPAHAYTQAKAPAAPTLYYESA